MSAAGIPALLVNLRRTHTLLTGVVCAGLAGGALLHAAGHASAGDAIWAAGVALVLIPLTISVLRALLHGQVGVDVIALLAMSGSLVLGEYLAGGVIALMLTGGNALEEYAQGKASRELSMLVSRAPREAHLRTGNQITEIAASDVTVDDTVVVRAGEIVPVDGVILDHPAVLDQSSLTGEPLPVTLQPGHLVMSGTTNAGNSFELRALRTARDSMYASIVELVEHAIARRAPMVRMADRFAVGFLGVTLVLALGSWLATGEAIRALAVLVIATPCPLILAPPVALVAGTSKAARRGIIVKGGAAIERLGRISTVLIDKTGTVTLGTPNIVNVSSHNAAFTPDQMLRLAGALEQLSVHSMGEAIAHAASTSRPLAIPTDVEETPGQGLTGTVNDHRVTVGSAGFLTSKGIPIPSSDPEDGIAHVHIGVDGVHAGTIDMQDTPRVDAANLGGLLRTVGVDRVVMVTGDHATPAQRVAAFAGIDEVHADCTPTRKLAVLHELTQDARPRGVVMVGDGVNDAPALAAADVGIAMGSAGATAASESAEAIILPGRISLVAEAIALGRRSRSIALQSVVAGMTLSIIGMGVAAAGMLPPVYGALTQEAIDLAVIVNALRALGGTSMTTDPSTG